MNMTPSFKTNELNSATAERRKSYKEAIFVLLCFLALAAFAAFFGAPDLVQELPVALLSP
jgi:hypothetical protein